MIRVGALAQFYRQCGHGIGVLKLLPVQILPDALDDVFDKCAPPHG